MTAPSLDRWLPGDPPPDTVTMFVTCGSALPATSTLTTIGG